MFGIGFILMGSEEACLYFLDAEDHEWGFTIFDHGCKTA